MNFEIGADGVPIAKNELVRALDGMGELELKILILLLANSKEGSVDTDMCKDEIISDAGISETDFISAIAYLRGAKLIKQKRGSAKKEKHLIEDKLPGYKEEELSDKIESTDGLRAVIDECQQIIGKIFSPADTSVIVGMSDRLGLSGEYITMLVAYSVGIGKKSLRYIEKSACSIYDEGVDTPEKLALYITKKESIHEARTQIIKMTGADGRALTSKESKLLDTWLDDYGYDVEVIKIAYEITVGRIKGPQYLPYMGAIIDAWYKKGFKSADDINAMNEAYKKSKNESLGNFDTDDFFNKAANKTKKSKMKG